MVNVETNHGSKLSSQWFVIVNLIVNGKAICKIKEFSHGKIIYNILKHGIAYPKCWDI